MRYPWHFGQWLHRHLSPLSQYGLIHQNDQEELATCFCTPATASDWTTTPLNTTIPPYDTGLGFIYTVLQYNYHATELPLGAWPARRSAIKWRAAWVNLSRGLDLRVVKPDQTSKLPHESRYRCLGKNIFLGIYHWTISCFIRGPFVSRQFYFILNGLWPLADGLSFWVGIK